MLPKKGWNSSIPSCPQKRGGDQSPSPSVPAQFVRLGGQDARCAGATVLLALLPSSCYGVKIPWNVPDSGDVLLHQGEAMLVLSRKVGERILIGDEICVTVVRIAPGTVRLGVEAPQRLQIVREEIKHQQQARPPDPKVASPSEGL